MYNKPYKIILEGMNGLTFLDTLQLLMGLFIPMAIGFFLYRTKMVDKTFIKGLSVLLYNVSLPCSILDSMMKSITLSELIQTAVFPLIALVVIILTFILGVVVSLVIEKNSKKRNIIIFCVMISNFTFTAYPILEMLYGKDSIFYASMYNFVMFASVLVIGTILIKNASCDDIDRSLTLKDLKSTPFLALILGFVLLFIPVQIPAFIKTTISQLSATTTPLGVLLTGLVIAKAGKVDFKNFKIYITSAFRLIIIPILAIFILKLIGFSGNYIYVPAIILANPVAVNLVIFAENFNSYPEECANYVLITSLISIITLPVVYHVLSIIL